MWRWVLEKLTQRDVRRIIRELSPEDRATIRATPEAELIRFHFGFGMHLRNEFRHTRFPFLGGYCRRVVEQNGQPVSFDALSSVAILEIWCALQTRNLRANSGRTR